MPEFVVAAFSASELHWYLEIGNARKKCCSKECQSSQVLSAPRCIAGACNIYKECGELHSLQKQI